MRREIAGFERHLYRLGLMADKGEHYGKVL